MTQQKTWILQGETTPAEISWLWTTNVRLEIEKLEILNIPVGNQHYTYTPPERAPIVYIKTTDEKQETILRLRFGERLTLVELSWYSVFHGSDIEF